MKFANACRWQAHCVADGTAQIANDLCGRQKYFRADRTLDGLDTVGALVQVWR
jgi:hypothetical protein